MTRFFGAGIAAALTAGLLLQACAGVAPRSTASSTPPPPNPETAGAPRLVSPPGDGQKLTLGEAVDQLSDGLLRAPPGTAWRPEVERAREIRRHRAALSALVEDADWVLALSAELEGPSPAADKARLRRLHEAYAAGAPHAEVAAQVNALLADTRDDRLRRELKKLANRSWERERRLRTEPAKSTAPSSRPFAEPAPASGSSSAASDSAAASSFGDAGEPPGTPASPERYCADRRAEAARKFAEARGTTDAAAREILLRQSLDLLDDCVNHHPKTPEADKARQNRARVEQELKR